MAIKGVIFDLDGTLLDTAASMAAAGNALLASYGKGPFPSDDYKLLVGDGPRVLVDRLLERSGLTNRVQKEEVYDAYVDYFKTNALLHVEHYDGMPKLLADLKLREIKLGVLSNKVHDQTLRVTEHYFEKDHFSPVFGLRPGKKRKPDPEGLFEILEQWGLTPAEVLYVGDTNVDMLTGKAASVFTVGVLWGFRTVEELVANGADVCIAKPEELLEIIERFRTRE